MIMPLVSVTFIGLTVAVALAAARQRSIPGALGRGIAGAWAGFACGALVGLTADVVLSAGGTLAVVGHYAAIGGAVTAAAKRG
jgi:hypothetical protein